MWFSFIQALSFGFVCLIVPGAILLRHMKFPWPWTFAFAPVLSLFLTCVSAQVLSYLPIHTNGLYVLGTALLFSIVLCIAYSLFLKLKRIHTDPITKLPLPTLSLIYPLVYILAAGIVCYISFISALDSPNSLALHWDLAHHLNTTRTMIEAGKFTLLSTNMYLPHEAAWAPWDVARSGFYPAAWNVLCASITSATGVNILACTHAISVLSMCVVFPLSIMSFIALVFSGEQKHMWAGVCVSSAFFAFGWSNIIFGPLYPFVMAMCMVPAVCSFWILVIQTLKITKAYSLKETPDTSTARDKACACAGAAWLVPLTLFILGILTLALAHPSTVFSVGTILIPYCVYEILILPSPLVLTHIAGHKLARTHTFSPRRLACAFGLFVLILWSLLYASLVRVGILAGFYWDFYTDFFSALRSFIGMNFATELFPQRMLQVPQPMLSIMVAVGGIVCWKRTRTRWMAIAFLYFGLVEIYMSAFNGPGKLFLSGFWYSDPQRIASNAALCAIPLATEGLASVHTFVSRMLTDVAKRVREADVAKRLRADDMQASDVFHGHAQLETAERKKQNTSITYLSASLVAVAFVAGVYTLYIPNEHYHLAEPWIYRNTANKEYSHNNELSNDELEFLQKVRDYLGSDEPVLNNPYDGSIVAYGIYGLSCVYRHPVTYYVNERDETRMLRIGLNNIRDSKAVQEALKKSGIHYVLRLKYPGVIKYPSNYISCEFAGIESINDTMPEFEPVLCQDEMRLYRIVYPLDEQNTSTNER